MKTLRFYCKKCRHQYLAKGKLIAPCPKCHRVNTNLGVVDDPLE